MENCIDIREVATRLSLSPRTIARLVASGALPSFRIGRRRLVRTEALTNFVDRHAG
jgi:excisionase family DNA binding protein